MGAIEVFALCVTCFAVAMIFGAGMHVALRTESIPGIILGLALVYVCGCGLALICHGETSSLSVTVFVVCGGLMLGYVLCGRWMNRHYPG